MKSVPVLESKLTVPELTDKILLTERLKVLGIASHRCALITAPAGCGKTTAVLLALDGVDARVCWYRLEQEDGRYAIFAAHLVMTLFQRISDPSRIQSPGMLSSMDDLCLFNAVLCQDAWECYGRDTVPVYLVLDNFHHAAHQPDIIECVRYMLSNMPPCVKIIVTSRQRTGLETGYGLTGKIAVFGTEELRFTPDETRVFCQEKFGITADRNDCRRLHEVSEGWIAGILMILLAFKASGAAHLGSFLEQSMNSEELFAYLTSETLKHEDAVTVNLLFRLALLEDFSPGELSGIFGIPDPEDYINVLTGRNLYLTRTMTGSGAVFRFHSLFRNALNTIGRIRLGADVLRGLHRQIAEYYRAAGRYDRAVRHYLEAGDTERAAGVITSHAESMLNEGLTETVKMLVESFPEDYRENNPFLLMYDGVTNKRVNFNRAILCLEKARILFKRQNNDAMRIKACLFLMMTCVYQNRFDIVQRMAEELKTIPGAMESEWCRRSLMLLSLSKAVLTENFPEANGIFSALLRYRLDPEEHCGAYLYGCALRHRQGDLDGAAEILRQLLNTTLVRLDLNWRSFALSLQSRVFMLQGELGRAQETVRGLLELGEKYAHHYSNANGRYYLALVKYLAHDQESAVHHICGAQREYILFENGVRACLCRLHHYLWVSSTGDAIPSSQIRAAYDELISMMPGQGDDDLAASLAGAALRENGDYEAAESLLLESYGKSTGKGALQSAAGAALHLAKLYFDTGDPVKGMQFLKSALLTCVEKGFSVFYDMHFPTLVTLCARAVRENIQKTYVRSVIRKYFGSAAENYLNRHAETLQTAASVQKFIGRYSRAVKQPAIRNISIQMFGGLRITAGDAVLDEGDFKTRKISGILKYLLLNRDRYITRETLADTFWPESGRKAALNSLRVALCEIRKTLSDISISFEDDSPLITENEYGFIISRKTCRTDTDLFMELYHKSKTTAPEDRKAALSAMIDLYGDGLLPLDIYDDYTAVDREYYSARFLEAAHEAANLLILESRFKDAEALLLRIIKLEPCDEAAHEALIRIYKETGQRHLADAMLRQYERMFAKEMQ